MTIYELIFRNDWHDAIATYGSPVAAWEQTPDARSMMRALQHAAFRYGRGSPAHVRHVLACCLIARTTMHFMGPCAQRVAERLLSRLEQGALRRPHDLPHMAIRWRLLDMMRFNHGSSEYWALATVLQVFHASEGPLEERDFHQVVAHVGEVYSGHHHRSGMSICDADFKKHILEQTMRDLADLLRCAIDASWLT